MEGLWGIVLVGGPLLLLVVFIFGWIRNREISKRDKLKSDRGTRELRRDIEREPDKDVDL